MREKAKIPKVHVRSVLDTQGSNLLSNYFLLFDFFIPIIFRGLLTRCPQNRNLVYVKCPPLFFDCNRELGCMTIFSEIRPYLIVKNLLSP